jgi:ergothioneine biosynthesis protein EgtB
MEARESRVIVASGDARSPAELRASLRARLIDARRRTDEVLACLEPMGMFERPVSERHRFVFYAGHLEAFDANLIGRDAMGNGPVDPELDALFAFGIDPLDGQGPSDTPADWPEPQRLQRYVAAARRSVDDALERAPLDGSVPWLEEGWCAAMAIEHRLMHAETLAYLLRLVPASLKRAGAVPDDIEADVRSLRLLEIPSGTVTLGSDRARSRHDRWDNEHDARVATVDGFRMASRAVTNSEYLRFVLEGGYRERSLWGDDDWAWVQASGIEHPACWSRDGTSFRWRGTLGDMPLAPSWPVFVSHAEASAYARWAGRRLPTEEQVHRAAFGTRQGIEREFPWGSEAPSAAHGVFDFERHEPAPAGSRLTGDSAWGVSDLLGNGWTWTRTIFAPLPGFEPLPFYPGYSAEFFDGRHFVMKGAGPRTAAVFLRRTFRNWFQPHLGHVHASIRLVED